MRGANATVIFCRLLTIEQGREAALLALLNGLATARGFLDDPSRLQRAIRLGVSLAADSLLGMLLWQAEPLKC